MFAKPAGMRAVVLESEGHVSVTTCPPPRVEEPTDVVVRVSLAGICGSDLHIVDGRDKGCRPGTIMGHEIVGVVHAVGHAVKRFSEGDRVVAPFTVNCGACFYCDAGLTGRCERSLGFGFVTEGGRGLQGGQAEFVRVPFADTSLVKLPAAFNDGQELEDKDALFLGDILSTAYGAAQAGRIKVGDVVAVVGLGPVGLLCVQAAKALGAAHVVAVDLDGVRRQKAATFGAVACEAAQARTICNELTQGRGADVVLEAVGTAPALDLALRLVRPGATIAIAGFHTQPVYPLPISEGYNLNLTITMGRCHARAQMDTLLPKLLLHQFRTREIITHVLPLSEAVHGYEVFRTRAEGAIKVLLAPQL